MNVHDAIMKAADHIEMYPITFHFGAWRVPRDCGSLGCALGWIGHFADSGQRMDDQVSTEVLGLGPRSNSDFVFYRFMTELCGSEVWKKSAKRCARTLRLYAAKYHAPAHRTDSELVADLMARIGKQTIPDGEIASPEYARV